MATGGGNGDTSSFFKLGEIRLAKDSDFQHFRQLADGNDGWTQKLDKNGLVVWSKETQDSSIKMMKVWVVTLVASTVHVLHKEHQGIGTQVQASFVHHLILVLQPMRLCAAVALSVPSVVFVFCYFLVGGMHICSKTPSP